MTELAYPIDHPAHPANAGKKFAEPRNTLNSDFVAGHPASMGAGQPIPTEAGSHIPRDGFKHFHGLPGNTLEERTKAFAMLPKDEQVARLLWNKFGVPAEPAEE